MHDSLDPDGRPVAIGPLVVRSPGLAGVATVRQPGDGGTRGPEAGTRELRAALAETDAREQYTLELTSLSAEASPDGGTRGGAKDADVLEVEVPAPAKGEGQMLLHIAEDGVASWHFPEELEHADGVQRGRKMVVYRVPAALVPVPKKADDAPSRGVVSTIAAKVLKFIVFPLLDPLLKKAGNHFATRFEKKRRFQRWRTFTPENHRIDDAPTLRRAEWERLAEGPSLLFVHGTGAMAHNAFSGLPQTVIEKLDRRYGGRMFALDHHSLSISPLRNIEIAAHDVPRDLEFDVDIVSHSRGGLVARELAERGADAGMPEGFRVRSLVMVGTPNAGTALAQRANIRTWLDAITNIAQFVPDNPITDLLSVALTVAKHVAIGAFEGLEGVTSMDPDGDYLRDLNVGVAPAAVYVAIAANFEPGDDSPLRRVHDAAIDRIFSGSENDLVVPTGGVGVVAGLSRFAPRSVVLDATSGVDHTSFFRSPRVVDELLSILEG